jgi:hypothetical protein
MPWPPTIGRPLPRCDDACGVQEKLAAYCLNEDHEIGATKARGFLQILGITLADIDYLDDALRDGVRHAPVARVRDNAPFGPLCEVPIAVRGLSQHQDRVAVVTTSWELRHAEDPPRLVTAYIAR